MSYGPVPTGAPPSRRRPGTVSGATALIYLYVVLLLVGAALLAVVFPDLERALAEAGADGSADAVRAMTGVAVAVGGCVLLVLGIAFVVLAVLVGKGRNGARITLWVLGGLMVCCGGLSAVSEVLGASGLQSGGSGDVQASLPEWYRWTSAGLQFVAMLALLAALILLALPASNAYFRPAPESWPPAAYPAYPAAGGPHHPVPQPLHPPQPGQYPPTGGYAPPHPGYGPPLGGPSPSAPPPGGPPPAAPPPAPPSAPPPAPPSAQPPAPPAGPPPSAPPAEREEP